jgi:hypothetical protein
MTIRSLALGGMTTLLLTFSAAASVAPPAQIGSPLAAQPVAQHNWQYYACQTDDGYGRHRPCDSNFKAKRHK